MSTEKARINKCNWTLTISLPKVVFSIHGQYLLQTVLGKPEKYPLLNKIEIGKKKKKGISSLSRRSTIPDLGTKGDIEQRLHRKSISTNYHWQHAMIVTTETLFIKTVQALITHQNTPNKAFHFLEHQKLMITIIKSTPILKIGTKIMTLNTRHDGYKKIKKEKVKEVKKLLASKLIQKTSDVTSENYQLIT